MRQTHIQSIQISHQLMSMQMPSDAAAEAPELNATICSF